ncbi:T9SS type B sorting domain-containing protein [Chryseobacterium polytrichastri]|uniref:Gliding motility-associated C-terminal domain-containing protein n=1 Tax=Chryseobacterium polytrichastri TaxID=1302687 RepID=A0A1M6WE00_9FLAO|nr:gliding motility-associated C-terminal domain-containing protein [Chryseobacterium polytrichastri]SHK91685.1 gliding motility-associated C-terminal domain-containing protein [Chryseobacterium polytrichastri]
MKKTLLIFLLLISQTFFSQADCTSALSVCGNSSITYSPTGIGAVNESLGGCLITGEHNSIWYKLTIATGGTLTFDLVPNDPAADYDWAVYGPNVTCGSLGAPIRCNAATVIGVGASTGLNMTSTLLSAAGGSSTPYCKYLDVLPGQTYYLYIDNWVDTINPTMAPFSLTWGGTATLASPFTDPAIQPHPFVPPGIPAANPANPREVIVCNNPAVFDFNTLSAVILNNNPNFLISYHTSQNDALSGASPILAPQTVNTTTTYYYSIHYLDPTNPNNPINSCRQVGAFKFKLGNITGLNVNLFACNNNNAGVGTFNLTTAAVFGDPAAIKKYYPTITDLNAGTNEILNPTAYIAAEGTVVVKIISPFGCIGTAIITLKFFPVVVVNDATLRSCFIETNPSTALFNLTNASVTTQAGTIKKYYPSVADALNGTNEIPNPTTYIAPNGVVYIKVTNGNGCFAIAKVTLIVIAPVFSAILKDKTICMEDKTMLDAGPGFSSYLWSTGATTQSITNVGVGTYWVKLKTGDCITTQTVKVYPSEQPVVSSIDISTTTVTVYVMGGAPAYKYSMDKITWQDSNIFTNVSRGNHVVYVKDSYDCEPIEITIVVPNLINVITPNGDGVNDVIDYSALAGKQNLVFNIFDRYGAKIFQADKFNGYKWDGTTNGGKKVPTGNYWYSVSWNETDKKNTPFKYTGWVMVKNRE